MGPKHVWASSIFFEKKDQSAPRADKGGKKEKDAFSLSALAVLLAATPMCTL
jgi:hypothetical protein